MTKQEILLLARPVILIGCLEEKMPSSSRIEDIAAIGFKSLGIRRIRVLADLGNKTEEKSRSNQYQRIAGTN